MDAKFSDNGGATFTPWRSIHQRMDMRGHREITPSMKKLTSNCQRSNQLAFISKREERFSIYICLLINFIIGNMWWIGKWQLTMCKEILQISLSVRIYVCIYTYPAIWQSWSTLPGLLVVFFCLFSKKLYAKKCSCKMQAKFHKVNERLHES